MNSPAANGATVPDLASPGTPSSSAGRWDDLRKRVLSAALLAPVALFCVWLGAEAWTALMAAAAIGLGMEWSVLCGLLPWRMPGLSVPLALVLAGAASVLDHERVALILLAIGALAVWRIAARRSLAAGVLYVGIPVTALVWLRGSDWVGRADVLFLVFVVWASDIGAYAFGRAFGGPKLAPAISPGKTWSGAAGGLLAAMLVGEAVAATLSPSAIGRAASIACALGIASQAGDLLESWVKRRFNVKDSGRLIPGHGGLLDRLDGLLAAAPVAAILAMLLGRESVLWN